MLSVLSPVQRTRIAGWFVCATAISYLLAIALDVSLLLPAIISWLAVAFCWPSLGKSAHKQAAILFSCGVLMLLWGAIKGTDVGLFSAISRNLPLLTMFTAVSFLALTNPEAVDTSQPMGKRGFWSTILSCHLLGAVINLSVIFVVGDRLQRKAPLTRGQVVVLMRGFCSGGYWSPFFIAFGVAMTYANGAQWTHTMVPGLILALLMAVFTYYEMRRYRINGFRGYPLKRDSLVMPLILAVIVLVLHYVYPAVHILTIISIAAPIAALLFLNGRPRKQVLVNYIERRLPSVASQFALFLAAGVFSSGVAALIASYPELFQFNIAHISPWVFWGASLIMILVGLIGVHPLVSVSLASPLLLPIAQDLNQLAFLYLSVWGTATAVSPLSGVGLAMVSRYQANSIGILRDNWRYLLFMWFCAGALNWIIFGS
ncbi:hypothetical protein [Shewanella mangrovi]|uniref:hypothetical protein n=1 Tax=Shewanella mangrovi TaxID=1515746 RepID=UPI00068D158C|nr:hypothetical protein [Shewanella mangrovi]